jgi:hypothetical protein
MLKRLTAILFIFVMAGQISAGVCGCLGGESRPQHSCCRHKLSTKDAIRQRGCCDNECAMQQSEKLPQDRTNATVKVSLKALIQPAALTLENFAPVKRQSVAPTVVATDHRLKYSRPPELFLRHHAFLI